MGDTDFVRGWLRRLESQMAELPHELQQEILESGGNLSKDSSPSQLAGWMRGVLDRMGKHVGESGRDKIMAGCGCSPSVESLQDVRDLYAETGDVDRCIEALQAQFVRMLENRMELDRETVEEVVRRGWGMAGVRSGNTITATKIPGGGKLAEYFRETDPEERRRMYCHCPWGRSLLAEQADDLSPFCYCGARYYKNIWEIILQKPVDVTLMTSVLRGDDVCRVEVHLPVD